MLKLNLYFAGIWINVKQKHMKTQAHIRTVDAVPSFRK